MMNSRLMLAAAMGALALPGLSNAAPAGQTFRLTAFPPAPVIAYRKGRRFGYGRGIQTRGKANPAGTKLARKAAKGTLTKCAIR